MKYAEVLLVARCASGNYTQDSIKRMFGGQERQIDFAHHIPVHITTRPRSSTIRASW